MRMLINCIYRKGDLQKRKLSNYLFVFGLSACDICNGQPTRVQMSEFGDVFKALTVSYLNFVDTDLSLEMLLKRPKWTCKRATVAAQLWPFQLSSVALLQVRRARMSKSAGFSGSLKPVFRSGWSFLAEVFLLIFFTVIRHLVKMPFTDFCVLSSLTYFDLELKKRLRMSSPPSSGSRLTAFPFYINVTLQSFLTLTKTYVLSLIKSFTLPNT